MLVNLTEKGLQLFGFKPGRNKINVPTDRAYLLMIESMAIKDKGFIRAYEKNNPGVNKSKPSPKRKPKQKATSKRAAKREKAIKK